MSSNKRPSANSQDSSKSSNKSTKPPLVPPRQVELPPIEELNQEESLTALRQPSPTFAPPTTPAPILENAGSLHSILEPAATTSAPNLENAGSLHSVLEPAATTSAPILENASKGSLHSKPEPTATDTTAVEPNPPPPIPPHPHERKKVPCPDPKKNSDLAETNLNPFVEDETLEAEEEEIIEVVPFTSMHSVISVTDNPFLDDGISFPPNEDVVPSLSNTELQRDNGIWIANLEQFTIKFLNKIFRRVELERKLKAAVKVPGQCRKTNNNTSNSQYPFIPSVDLDSGDYQQDEAALAVELNAMLDEIAEVLTSVSPAYLDPITLIFSSLVELKSKDFGRTDNREILRKVDDYEALIKCDSHKCLNSVEDWLQILTDFINGIRADTEKLRKFPRIITKCYSTESKLCQEVCEVFSDDEFQTVNIKKMCKLKPKPPERPPWRLTYKSGDECFPRKDTANFCPAVKYTKGGCPILTGGKGTSCGISKFGKKSSLPDCSFPKNYAPSTPPTCRSTNSRKLGRFISALNVSANYGHSQRIIAAPCRCGCCSKNNEIPNICGILYTRYRANHPDPEECPMVLEGTGTGEMTFPSITNFRNIRPLNYPGNPEFQTPTRCMPNQKKETCYGTGGAKLNKQFPCGSRGSCCQESCRPSYDKRSCGSGCGSRPVRRKLRQGDSGMNNNDCATSTTNLPDARSLGPMSMEQFNASMIGSLGQATRLAASNMSQGTYNEEIMRMTQGSGFDMGGLSQQQWGQSVTSQRQGQSVTTQPYGQSVTSQQPGQSVTQPYGQSVTSQQPGQSVTSQPYGQSVTSQRPGQSVTTQPYGQSVTSQQPGQSVTSQPYGQSVTSQRPGQSVTTQPYGQSVTSQQQGQSVTSQPYGQSVTSQRPGQSVTTQPYGQSVTSQQQGQSVTSQPYGQSVTSQPYGQSVTSQRPGQSVTTQPYGQSATSQRMGTGLPSQQQSTSRNVAFQQNKSVASQQASHQISQMVQVPDNIQQGFQKIHHGKQCVKRVKNVGLPDAEQFNATMVDALGQAASNTLQGKYNEEIMRMTAQGSGFNMGDVASAQYSGQGQVSMTSWRPGQDPRHQQHGLSQQQWSNSLANQQQGQSVTSQWPGTGLPSQQQYKSVASQQASMVPVPDIIHQGFQKTHHGKQCVKRPKNVGVPDVRNLGPMNMEQFNATMVDALNTSHGKYNEEMMRMTAQGSGFDMRDVASAQYGGQGQVSMTSSRPGQDPQHPQHGLSQQQWNNSVASQQQGQSVANQQASHQYSQIPVPDIIHQVFQKTHHGKQCVKRVKNGGLPDGRNLGPMDMEQFNAGTVDALDMSQGTYNEEIMRMTAQGSGFDLNVVASLKSVTSQQQEGCASNNEGCPSGIKRGLSPSPTVRRMMTTTQSHITSSGTELFHKRSERNPTGTSRMDSELCITASKPSLAGVPRCGGGKTTSHLKGEGPCTTRSQPSVPGLPRCKTKTGSRTVCTTKSQPSIPGMKRCPTKSRSRPACTTKSQPSIPGVATCHPNPTPDFEEVEVEEEEVPPAPEEFSDKPESRPPSEHSVKQESPPLSKHSRTITPEESTHSKGPSSVEHSRISLSPRESLPHSPSPTNNSPINERASGQDRETEEELEWPEPPPPGPLEKKRRSTKQPPPPPPPPAHVETKPPPKLPTPGKKYNSPFKFKKIRPPDVPCEVAMSDLPECHPLKTPYPPQYRYDEVRLQRYMRHCELIKNMCSGKDQGFNPEGIPPDPDKIREFPPPDRCYLPPFPGATMGAGCGTEKYSGNCPFPKPKKSEKCPEDCYFDCGGICPMSHLGEGCPVPPPFKPKKKKKQKNDEFFTFDYITVKREKNANQEPEKDYCERYKEKIQQQQSGQCENECEHSGRRGKDCFDGQPPPPDNIARLLQRRDVQVVQEQKTEIVKKHTDGGPEQLVTHMETFYTKTPDGKITALKNPSQNNNSLPTPTTDQWITDEVNTNLKKITKGQTFAGECPRVPTEWEKEFMEFATSCNRPKNKPKPTHPKTPNFRPFGH